jgi:hypothetical protein
VRSLVVPQAAGPRGGPVPVVLCPSFRLLEEDDGPPDPRLLKRRSERLADLYDSDDDTDDDDDDDDKKEDGDAPLQTGASLSLKRWVVLYRSLACRRPLLILTL